MAVNHVEATPPRYRVTWLTDPGDPDVLGFFPNPFTMGTMGINDKTQCVYAYAPGSNDPISAWVWLPTADYSMSAGWHNLNSILEHEVEAIARDINNQGQIVGQYNTIECVLDYTNFGGCACIWELGSSIDFDTFGTLEGTCASTNASGAHAINNNNPPTIVGFSSRVRTCFCDGTGNSARHSAGFKLALGGSMTELTSGSGRNSNATYDVHTELSNHSSLWTVGSRTCYWGGGVEPEPCHVPLNPECEPEEGAYWANTSVSGLSDSGEGRGINEELEVVGYGYGDDCFRIAKYWPSPSSSPFDLGGVMPLGQDEDQSVAFAINNLALPQVVGMNRTETFGLLWEKTGSSSSDWDVANLNNLIGDAQLTWNILQAHDINEYSEVVGLATQEGYNGICAVLLTPFPACPADLNGDGCVTMADYTIIINYYAGCPYLAGCGCPPAQICVWDMDGDYDVDNLDTKFVFDSVCVEPDNTACCSECQESFMEEEDSPLEQAIAIVLLSSLTNEQKQQLIESLLE